MYADFIILISFTGLVGEFDILHENTSTQGVAYDYKSVMHLNAFAFAKGTNETMLPLKSDCPLYDTILPSSLDILHANILYCEGNEY